MIRVSVFYPYKEGAKFDHDYYAQQHMPLVRNRLSKFGLVRLEADKGVAGEAPHLSPPFICIGHLYFQSLADFHVAMDAEGDGLMADIPNYTNLTPQIQVSEIVGS